MPRVDLASDRRPGLAHGDPRPGAIAGGAGPVEPGHCGTQLEAGDLAPDDLAEQG